MKNAYRKIQLLILFSIITFSVNAANRYWIASSTANWNSTTNWSTTSGGAGGASVPGTNDNAIFDGNGLGRCNINANASVLHFDVRNGYTDSIVQQNSYTVTVATNGSFAVSGGIFIGGNANIINSGSFTLDSSGVFTSTSGVFSIRNAITIEDGDKYNHNNGQLSLTSYSSGSEITVDMDTIALYKFRINNTSGDKKVTFAADNIITVENDIELSGSTTSYDIALFGGVINAKKNIIINYYKSLDYGQGTTEIIINGSGTQTINATGNNSGALFKVTINKGSDTLKIIDDFHVHNNWDYNSGIIKHENSSIIRFYYPFTISGSMNFNYLIFQGETITSGGTQWNITDEITVDSILMFNGDGIVYLLGGEIHCMDNFNISTNTAINGSAGSSTLIGTTKIFFDSNEDQYWIGRSTGSKTWMPVVIIDKSDGTLFISDNISIGGQLHYIRGDIDYGTSTITFVKNCIVTGNDFGLYNVTLLPSILYDAAIDVEDSTILTVNGSLSFANTDYNDQSYFAGGSIHAKGNIVVGNDVAIDNNVAEIIINGSGNQTLDGIANYDEGNLPNVIINKSEGTLFLKDYINVCGNWKYIQGTIDFSTYTNYLCMRSTYNPTIIGSHEIKNLIFYRPSSSGSKTFKIRNTSTLTVNGNLSTYGTSLFVLDSGTIDVKGNITVSSGLNGGMGTIKVSGTGNQTFTGATSLITGKLPNFTINKSSGTFTVTNYFNVAKTLALTNGIISTANNSSKVHLLDNATLSGGSTSSYVDGIVSKLGNDAFKYPIGESGKYRPISMSAPSSTTDRFEAEYFYSAQAIGTVLDTGIYDISNCEYINFTRQAGTSSVSKKIEWSDNTCEIPADTTNLAIAYWNGTKWVKLITNDVSGNAKEGWIISNSNANFGYLIFALVGPPYYYPKLNYQLDNEYYLTKKRKVYFMYDEEYDVGSSYLEYKIYDEARNIVAESNISGFSSISGSPITTISYGENFLNLDLNNLSLSSGFYILEVIGRKNDKYYLRFKF